MVFVVIVEDHPVMRFGLVQAFNFEPDIEVVGAVSNAEEGLRIIRALNPTVTLVDINLPGSMNGIQLLQQVIAEKLLTKIFLLTGYSDPVQIIQAVRSGASAYQTKDTELDQIIETIRKVARGMYVVENREFKNEAELKKWLGEQGKTGPLTPFTDDPNLQQIKHLAPREMEIAIHIARGLSNQDIAQTMGIGHQTVKNYVTSILSKLQLQDRTQLAAFAIKMGWVNVSRP